MTDNLDSNIDFDAVMENLDQLQKDRERLDWLEKGRFWLEPVTAIDGEQLWGVSPFDGPRDVRPTIREAIDAAREEKP